MAERCVTIVNTRGLHARSAAKLVAAAKPYNCMMALMMLAAGMGTQVRVCAEGEDAEAALDSICALIDAGFDEED